MTCIVRNMNNKKLERQIMMGEPVLLEHWYITKHSMYIFVHFSEMYKVDMLILQIIKTNSRLIIGIEIILKMI